MTAHSWCRRKFAAALSFWRHLPLRAQIVAGFAVPVIMVAGLSGFVERAVDEAGAHAHATERSIRAVVVRAELLNAVLNAETGERGYIITGDTSFLAPYTSGRAQFTRSALEWRQLREGVHDPHLEAAEGLFRRWLQEVAEPAIEARRDSPPKLSSLGMQATLVLMELDQRLHTAAPLPLEQADIARVQDALQAALQAATGTTDTERWLQLGLQSQRLQPLLNRIADAAPEAGHAALREQAATLSRQMVMQLVALTHSAGRGQALAADLIVSGRGKEMVDQVRGLVAQSIAEQEQLHLGLAETLSAHMQTMRLLSIMLPLVGVGLGLALLLLMQLDLIRSIQKLREGTRRIEEGDLSARVDDQRFDELGALGSGFNRMAVRLQQAEREATLLDGLQSMLISSNSEEEVFAAVARAFEKLLPRLQGAIYVLAASRDFAERKMSWGRADDSLLRFSPEQCRALRLGRTHVAGQDSAELFCVHTHHQRLHCSVCIPLTTRDEVLGTLFLFDGDTAAADLAPREVTLAENLAERLALALSNLRLTEKLRRESVRDPLTGLFNRRYFEETFQREMARVQRAQEHLAVLAVDVDHFKRFNDTFGHDAGDLVLKELAGKILGSVRQSDIACRFGGEEFLVLLPEANAGAAYERAEALRKQVSEMQLHYGGSALGTLTISVGIAVYPLHAQAKEQLLRLADNALYSAKRQGRNRTVISSAELVLNVL